MSENQKVQGTLLIADDEPDILEILREFLSPHIQTILTVSNGLETLNQVREGNVDAVLSDINMPKMSGLAALSEVRKLGLELPFVVLTAFGDKANLQEAIRLDATDFLEKPFDPNEVIRVATRATTLGLNIRAMEAELNQVFANSDLPPAEIERIKKVKRTISAMRIRFATFNVKNT